MSQSFISCFDLALTGATWYRLTHAKVYSGVVLISPSQGQRGIVANAFRADRTQF